MAQTAGFAERLAAARRGDATAWTQLYHDVAPLVIGYLRAQRLPDPEDVAGEVLLEVVRDLHRFCGDQSRFRSWVLAIAHHRLLDARRREQRRPLLPTPADELDVTAAADDPEAETLAAIGLGELAPALGVLTEDQRTVLLLRVIGDLPLAEVARITGRRTGAVKQLQRRAVDALRRHLDEQAETAEAGATVPPVTTRASVGGGADTTLTSRGGRTARDTGAAPDASPAGWPT